MKKLNSIFFCFITLLFFSCNKDFRSALKMPNADYSTKTIIQKLKQMNFRTIFIKHALLGKFLM